MFEHINFRDSATGLVGARTQRAAALAMLVSVVAMMALTGTAAAQTTEGSDLDVCNEGYEFTDFIANIITLIVFAGVIGGTIAIVMGFASEAVPFLDSSMSSWKMAGLKYGWGLPILLYGMNMAASVIGINVSCMLPGV